MRHAVFAAALIPSLVFAVDPVQGASARPMLATQDSCGAIVDSALHVARERTAGADRSPAVRRYFYAHEVTKRAAIARRDATPARADSRAAVLQFVVGPSGVADTSSVRIVGAQQSTLRQSDAVARVRSWSFQPAEVRQCPVAQLVQTRAR
jgi:hypothetical protein